MSNDKGLKSTRLLLSKALAQFTESEKLKVKQRLVKTLADNTPVDTGNARDGWRYNNSSVYNDVPYIEHLNAGTSEQAPAFFIEKTVLSTPSLRIAGSIVRVK